MVYWVNCSTLGYIMAYYGIILMSACSHNRPSLPLKLLTGLRHTGNRPSELNPRWVEATQTLKEKHLSKEYTLYHIQVFYMFELQLYCLIEGFWKVWEQCISVVLMMR